MLLKIFFRKLFIYYPFEKKGKCQKKIIFLRYSDDFEGWAPCLEATRLIATEFVDIIFVNAKLGV